MVPKGWTYLNLGKVAELQRGFDLPTALRIEGSVPIISSAGLSGFHNEAKVKGPGVVTGRYGSIGDVFLVMEDFWPLNTSLWVKNFHGNDPWFIYYMLCNFDFKKFSDKTGVPGVNRNDLHAVKVGVPPLPEQRKIAQILSTWDKAIATTERLLANKQQQKKALMQRLLTGKQRFAGFDGEWLYTELMNVTEFIKDGTHGTHERVESGIPLLAATNISPTGLIIFDGASNISEIEYNKIHAKYHIQKDDVLITVVGTIGRSAIVRDVPTFTLQRSVAIIRTDRSKLSSDYFYVVTQSQYFQSQLKKRANITAQPGVYLGELAKIRLPVPSLAEQQTIASVLLVTDTEITKIQSQLDNLKLQKKALMQQLLTGKRRVKVDEVAA